MINVLFICSMNKWRSPTAERIYRNHSGIAVRSAGTRSAAKRTVSAKDIDWADVVCVMEDSHKSRLRSDFRGAMRSKMLYVLDIPDDYVFMDPELVAILNATLDPIIDHMVAAVQGDAG